MFLSKKKEILKETTGSLMKKEYVWVDQYQTINQALYKIKQDVKKKKNIHYVYVTNEDQQVIGVLSMKELITAEGKGLISKIMKRDLIYFPIDLDQEKAAEIFRQTDLLSIPVLDDQKRLMGVVHLDDMLDVLKQETTEDFHRMAPVARELEDSLMGASISLLYRKRIVWLVILVFMNVFSGAGIAHFEDVIEANIALVFFLPLLVDSGGNAGSQSATLVIRALATGDLRLKDWFKMFSKEISVSFLMGLTMAGAVSLVGLWRGGIEIALVVALTMTAIVIVGSLIGMSLPFLFRKFKLDPATASAPLITSICDIVGVLIYFGIASYLLEIV